MSWHQIERSLKHVHKIFKEDPDYVFMIDAYRILRLGMHCIEFCPPTMKEALESLQVCECKGKELQKGIL